MALEIVPASMLPLEELRESFVLGYSDYIVPVDASPEAFAAHIHHNDIDLSRSMAAVENGEVIGLAMAGIRGERAWLGGMAVVPGSRGKGVGDALLGRYIENLRAEGIRTIQLEVIEGNQPARELYIKKGFRDRGMLHCLQGSAPFKWEGKTESEISGCGWKDIASQHPEGQCWQKQHASIGKIDGMRFAGCWKEGEMTGYAGYFPPKEKLTIYALGGEIGPVLEYLGSTPDIAGLRAINFREGKTKLALEALGFETFLLQHEMILELNG